MSILNELQKGDIIYCGYDRVHPENYYYLSYEPANQAERYSGWVDQVAGEFLVSLGIKTKPSSDPDYAKAGDLDASNCIFHEGYKDMHPKIYELYGQWKFTNNRMALELLRRD